MTAQSCSQKYKSDSLETSRMHWILMSICHSIIFSRADKTDGYAYLRANRANNKGRSNERLLPYGFWQIVCGDGGFV